MKILKLTAQILAIYFIATACAKNSSENSFVFPVEDRTVNIELQAEDLLFDSIFFETKGISFAGELIKHQNKFYFIDQVFGQICIYNLNGQQEGCYIGLGKGPNEVRGIDEVLFTEEFIILTHDWDIYLFDYNFKKIRSFSLNFGEDNRRSLEDLTQNPDLSDKVMYEVQYLTNELALDSEKRLLIKIVTEHPSENAFISRKFYQEARILAAVNLNTGRIEKISGRMSPAYVNYNFIPHHIYSYYAVTDEHIYLGYEPDPYIYVFSLEFDPLFKFKYEVDEIDLKYQQTDYLSAFEDSEYFKLSREKEGYYGDIFIQDSFIYRKYHREDNSWGLIVFNENRPIANFNIPSRFEIIGGDKERIYVDGIIDEENENLAILYFEKSKLTKR